MSQTRLRGSAVFRATGLVGELAKVAQVGSEVGVEVMDACLVTMESMIGLSVIFLHTRDVLAFLDVAEPILCDAHASYRAYRARNMTCGTVTSSVPWISVASTC
jgi:hypothetical protein